MEYNGNVSNFCLRKRLKSTGYLSSFPRFKNDESWKMTKVVESTPDNKGKLTSYHPLTFSLTCSSVIVDSRIFSSYDLLVSTYISEFVANVTDLLKNVTDAISVWLMTSGLRYWIFKSNGRKKSSCRVALQITLQEIYHGRWIFSQVFILSHTN